MTKTLTISIILSWMTLTGLFAQDLQKTNTFDIRNFGARPNDGKDDTRAVGKVMKLIKKQGGGRLVFPKGRYDFYPAFADEFYFHISNNDEGLKRVTFSMRGIDNLTIDGNGSLFMFHGFLNPFILDGSSNIRLENFAIDFSRSFHSEAIITADPEEGLDVRIKEGFPYKVKDGMLLFTDGGKNEGPQTTVSKENIYGSNHMLEFDTKRQETAYMVKDFYFSTINGYPAKQLKDGTVRILVPRLKGTVGNTMVFGPNHRKYPAFVLSDCSDVHFSTVTLHHAGGMGILGQRTHNVVIDNCKVTPSKGRILSTTADATHFVNGTGKIVLSNNIFENQKDDATNIHGIYVQVSSVDDDEVTVRLVHRQQHGFDFLKPGTKVELVRGKSMITYATVTVATVDKINKEYSIIRFKEGLPKGVRINDAIAEVRDYPEVTIVNNIIRKNRARGMLLNCRGKTIVDNNYFHSPGAAILFEGDAFYWYEQGGVRDCRISNNVFDNCLYGVWGKAVIDVKAGIKEDLNKSRYNRNILIENNTFRIYDEGTLLNLYCVDNLVWRDNTVEYTKEYPPRKRKFERFQVQHCDNVTIEKFED
ncbi:MAG: right-handed parallel beta-helix repeat-containing protein [Planctomycetes bacterium]|nr:right-handed parallel beta-helix repeat-containing protein [Planctomycetota bacterium]